MDYNFHTHTTRCRHATGSDEDYVKCAIVAGIKYLGFSDHAPFLFPDGYDDGYRVPVSEAADYIESIRNLRKKYKDQIKITIGFEMEYYPRYFEEMLKFARNIGAEYLILGQHFILSEHPDGKGSIGPTDSEEHLKTYVDEVITAMKTGLFSYIAHPDLVCFTGDEDVYLREAKRLCLASRDLDIPLEINLLGIRGSRHYPSDRFFSIAGKVGAPVTIGVDAHASNDLLNKETLNIAMKLIKKHNLNYIGIPKIRKI